MVVINPEVENTLELESIEWRPLLTAHKKRSSEIMVSPDQKYLKKTKRRKGTKRDFEFYNLAFWGDLFKIYHEETGSEIYSPLPYISEGRDVVMQYVSGIDLDRLFSSGSVDSKNVLKILENVGKLFKIKENEDLLHNDFDLRHILINGGLYVIDLENAQYGNGEVKKENQRLKGIMENACETGIEGPLLKGYESVPRIGVLDGALGSVKSVYGSRAEYYLKSRYRNKT